MAAAISALAILCYGAFYQVLCVTGGKGTWPIFFVVVLIGDVQAIGIVDDSGHPKTGRHTACVGRQYCGRTGMVDNCVVTVHLS